MGHGCHQTLCNLLCLGPWLQPNPIRFWAMAVTKTYKIDLVLGDGKGGFEETPTDSLDTNTTNEQ